MVGDRPRAAPAAVLECKLSDLAHGMAGDLAVPDWPRLTPAELAPLLEAYPGLGAVDRVAWHSQRPFAASAIVRCKGGEVFVKRQDPSFRCAADVMEEHAFIAHLRRNGIPVPAVLATAGGATAIDGAAGVYEVHALGEGADLYRDAHSWTPARSSAEAEAIGRALGVLHRAAQGFIAPARRTRLLVAGDSLIRADDLQAALLRSVADDARLRCALASRDWRTDFQEVLSGLHRAVGPHIAAMTPLWVHGDFHASNLLWHDGQVSAVLDFGLANRASAVFDLATAIERNAIEWLRLAPGHAGIGRPGLARALLRGYDAARPRPQEEARALRHILPLVHMDFALSELAYFHGVTACMRNADAAYDAYLLGHAAWFAGPDGQRFLDQLSAPLEAHR